MPTTQPRRSSSRRINGENVMMIAFSVVLFCCAVALLGYVAISLRNGFFDARSRNVPPEQPSFIYASEEPFWFYGLNALAAALGIFGAILAWGMIREALKGGGDPRRSSPLRRIGRGRPRRTKPHPKGP